MFLLILLNKLTKGNKMKGLKRRILSDLFITPTVILPLVIGVASLLLSEIVGTIGVLIGMVSCMIAVGGAALNLILNVNRIADKAHKDLKNAQKRKLETELDALHRKLLTDSDPRDQEALQNIRSLYRSFCLDVDNGTIASASKSIVESVDTLYLGIIKQLNRQFELWSVSNKVAEPMRTKLLSQRDKLIKEIELSISNFALAITEIRTLGLKLDDGELDSLQERLQLQLKAAIKTESILSEDEFDRFKEYE